MEKENNKDRLIKLLGEETYFGIEQFVRKINDERADIILLIARKALCLFRLLPYLNIELPKAEIVSDRVLDLNLEYFEKKKVIVVDDTLILGTTLKNIKEKLLKAKSDVKIYTYCIDKTNWQKDLINPDYAEKFYSSADVLKFCNSLVKSFSVVSIPYLVDFPITNTGKIPKNVFSQLIIDKNLKVIELPNYDISNTSLYTILLSEKIKAEFYNYVGNDIRQIVDVLKIRVYCINRQDGDVNLRFVPIVLLKRMDINTINSIFNYIVNHSIQNYFVKQRLNTHQIRLRFVQYFLSVKLGFVFFQQVFHKVYSRNYKYKKSELIFIFGKEIADIYSQLLTINILPIEGKIQFYDASYPDSDYKDIFEDINVKGYNILQSFQDIFANLVDKREIPARKWYNDKTGPLPLSVRDRLINGISFDEISDFFSKKLDIKTTDDIKDIFSVCLDVSNDLGISVPIICNNNGCLYRAYRHGELGKKSKNNIILLKHYLDSFCEKSGYDSTQGFDKVLLEKLTVIFFRIGAKSDFIDRTYNYNDPEAINIGYYLFGAVAISNNDNDFFPNRAEDWFLNSHCHSLFKLCGDKKYHYDIIPNEEGTSVNLKDIVSAKDLGEMLGYIIHFDRPNKEGKPLNIERLTLIASCYSLGDITNALTAELIIILRWISGVNKLNISENHVFAANLPFANFSTSTVYKAFNQALFKFSKSFTEKGSVLKIIENTEEYLLQKKCTQKELMRWKLYSSQLGIGNEDIFKWGYNKPDEYMTIDFIKEIFMEISYSGLILILIRYILDVYENYNSPHIGIGSCFTFIDTRTKKEHSRTLVDKNVRDLNPLAAMNKEISLFSVGKFFYKMKKNSRVSFSYRKKSYDFLVLSINNEKIQYPSESEIEEFHDKVLSVLKTGNDEFNKKYINITRQMKIIRNSTSNSNLVYHLKKTIKELASRTGRMEKIINESKIRYKNSRENYVTLLSTKPRI